MNAVMFSRMTPATRLSWIVDSRPCTVENAPVWRKLERMSIGTIILIICGVPVVVIMLIAVYTAWQIRQQEIDRNK